MPFTMGGHVARRFRAGRAFLVGDAAHRTTPVGGTGMNTAIHAAHNLGWKLGWVVRGLAGDALLDSYEPERRPIGTDNVVRSLRRGEVAGDGLSWDLGVRYESAVIAAGPTVPRSPATARRTPASSSAGGALHARRVRRRGDGARGDGGGPRRGRRAGPVRPVCRCGCASWHRRYRRHRRGGVTLRARSADAVILVRPDGYIAWRGRGGAGIAAAGGTRSAAPRPSGGRRRREPPAGATPGPRTRWRRPPPPGSGWPGPPPRRRR